MRRAEERLGPSQDRSTCARRFAQRRALARRCRPGGAAALGLLAGRGPALTSLWGQSERAESLVNAVWDAEA